MRHEKWLAGWVVAVATISACEVEPPVGAERLEVSTLQTPIRMESVQTYTDERARSEALTRLKDRLNDLNAELLSGGTSDLVIRKIDDLQGTIAMLETLRFPGDSERGRNLAPSAGLSFFNPTKTAMDWGGGGLLVLDLWTTTNLFATLRHSSTVTADGAFIGNLGAGPRSGVAQIYSWTTFTGFNCNVRHSASARSTHRASNSSQSISQTSGAGDACGPTSSGDGSLDLEPPWQHKPSSGGSVNLCAEFKIPAGCYDVYIDGRYSGTICC